MKKILILGGLIFTLATVKAQKQQNIYFLDKKGKEVKIKDSADYIRIIQEPDSGDTNYTLYEFYRDEKKKKQGKVSSFETKLVYEGPLISYNRDGIKESVVNYKKGTKVGMAYYYFSNSKLKKQVEYMQVASSANQMVGPSNDMTSKTRVIFMQDSLGNVSVNDGNGHAIEKVGEIKGDGLFEEGEYKDGYKDGVWNGKYTINTTRHYTEKYEMGKLITGENFHDGKVYTYTVSESPPEFSGGQKAWANFIARTTRYPAEAVKAEISGTVLTSFVVDEEGRITDIKITKSVHESLDNEAKRVLQQSSRWIPGKQRGIPVKVIYVQSFKFRTN